MVRGLLDIGKSSSLEGLKFEFVWDALVAWRVECKFFFLFFWVCGGHLYCPVNDEISDAK